ncbi:MAG: phosphate acetyltransferase [Myxococcales bacterium]|nr:phosphate acetyltransferase [Myxococcales bacterium]
MSETLLVISAGSRGNGLTSISLGLVRAFQRLRVRVGFCKPVAQPHGDPRAVDGAVELARRVTHVDAPDPIPREDVERMLAAGDEQLLLEYVVETCHRAARDVDVLIVEGLVPVDDAVYGTGLNMGMARALDARVVLVGAPEGRSPAEMAAAIGLAARSYGTVGDGLFGAVLNKVRDDADEPPGEVIDEVGVASVPAEVWRSYGAALRSEGVQCLGLVPFSPVLAAPRVREVAQSLGAEILRAGGLDRRVHTIEVGAMTPPNLVRKGLRRGTLVITPGDRSDTLMACALAEQAGLHLAGVLLTGDLEPDAEVMGLCEPAFVAGLPVLRVPQNTFAAAREATQLARDVPHDDPQRAERVIDTVAGGLDLMALSAVVRDDREPHISPPAFRYSLIERARAANKRIVLPEGEEPRTITAAVICARRGIARCALVGNPDVIAATAKRQGLTLPDAVEVLDPRDHVDRFVEPLVALRAHKGLHPVQAKGELQDNVVLGTMMLKMGEVDGLVSGALHTTANTIRPALQLIKTAPGYSLVSSVFFMCLPEQVLVYGDCAVNPDPTAAQLAEIAVQSAESALAFGITPRIAMISYSTGSSGQGADVAKVVEATALVKQSRPDLLVDGPLQYDAASVESVGRSKAPDSPVAGRATVFVFPDLNTGNTTYKAVQRSANVVSIGPLLQGLAMPVNDLSRGALVDDIVYTIALTAIQAEQRARREAAAGPGAPTEALSAAPTLPDGAPPRER